MDYADFPSCGTAFHFRGSLGLIYKLEKKWLSNLASLAEFVKDTRNAVQQTPQQIQRMQSQLSLPQQNTLQLPQHMYSLRYKAELRERIQPYFLRRLKSEVFHEDDSAENSKLSKKNEIIVWLRLTRCQSQLYEAFLKSEIVLSAFDGSPLAAIMILKKICDHPYLLTKRAVGMGSMLNQEDCGLAEKLAMHAAS